jgi:hypothetical protein
MARVLALFAVMAVACSGQASPAVDPTPPTTPVMESSTVPATTAPTAVDTTVPPPPTPAPTTAATSAATTTTVAATTTSHPPREGWFVVWVTGRMPDGFSAGLRSVPGVSVVSEVWVGNAAVIETRTANGVVVDSAPSRFVFPVEVQAIDPEGHADFVPPDVAASLNALRPDEVLLGSSSAAFRRLGVGATVELSDGTLLTVAGIADDRWVGFAEMVTTAADPSALGADRPRYAVVGYDGNRAELEEAAAGITDRALRVWAEDEVPVFRHADAVQPQIRIKERFGEFSYRPRGGQRVEIDPGWVEENIVTVDMPLIGPMRCHREFAAALLLVMERLEADGDGSIINRASNTGCFNQRFIAGRRDLSRHAWGIAADINWGNDPEGTRSPIAPALLDAMTANGITSGHDWINPDPGHFEWYSG